MDSGPMALFYNKEVFDAAGVDRAPATWEEYYQAARKIRAIGKYITSDAGDPGFFDSMVWQAGGQPFSTHRKKVAINLTDDAGTQRWTAYWQRMIDEDLIDTRTVKWSNDWDRGLSDGTIASVLAGGWLPHSLLSDVPQGAGRFRVAQTPTWEPGGTQNSENGGSTLAIMRTTSDEKAAAAYRFMDYATHDSEGIRGRVLDGGLSGRQRHPGQCRVPGPDDPDHTGRRGQRVLRRPEVQPGIVAGRKECAAQP
ncbi:ABC transporter substrate-binding protein [Propionibacterium freudenreichii]|uniref:ABC transporter substrate-binding protein n=1 Tax=Propionibacterium freudenreichii TaxID=1744 RepID=UPI0023EA607C|nr:extracellular solute-binding protein [Propionibacterium freudenreichii]